MATHNDTNDSSAPLYDEIAPFYCDALREGYAEGAGIAPETVTLARVGDVRHGFDLLVNGERRLFLRYTGGRIAAAAPWPEGWTEISRHGLPPDPSATVSAEREPRAAGKDLGRRLDADARIWLRTVSERIEEARAYVSGSLSLLTDIAEILGERVLGQDRIYLSSAPNRRTHGKIEPSGPDAVRMEITLDADLARSVARVLAEGL